MVGSAIVRALSEAGCHNLVLRTRAQLDLRDQAAVDAFFENERPDYVFLAAAKVGGINANNSYPADFIYDNIMIATNVIAAAHHTDCKRLLFLGSSCIYPKRAPQPIPESALLTGPLEPTNEPYAIAKIAGIKLCESFARQYNRDFRSVMPTNLYGPGDNFDLQTSHVIPALIRKFREAATTGASSVEVWGTGCPRREFLHVDDLADACLFVMTIPRSVYDTSTSPNLSHLNVGTGVDITIRDLAEMVAALTGFKGDIVYNNAYPDGTQQKLLDVSTLARLGWIARIPLPNGLRDVIASYDVERAKSAR